MFSKPTLPNLTVIYITPFFQLKIQQNKLEVGEKIQREKQGRMIQNETIH